MNRRVALFDVDRVIYDSHTIFGIIQDQEKAGFIKTGIWNKIEEDLNAYEAKEKTYEEAANSMLLNYLSFLKGKKYSDMLAHNKQFFNRNKEKFFNYFKKALPKLKEKYDVYLVTTNLQFTAEALGEFLDVENYISSEAQVEKGIITGELTSSLAANKGIVRKLFNEYQNEDSLAVGDSENDIDMLKEVEIPIAFEPDENLKVYAEKNNWMVSDRNNMYEKLIDLI